MTRAEAFEHLGNVIVICVPEDSSNWLDRRAMLRRAAMSYCHSAVAEAVVNAFATMRESAET